MVSHGLQTCPAGLCPAAAAQVSDWPLLGARRLPRPILSAAAQQRLLTARARAAAPEDAGCSGSPSARAAGSTAARDPAATRLGGDEVLPTSVPLWSSGCQLCRLLGSSCRALIGSRMDDGWMDRVFWFFFLSLVLFCDREVLSSPGWPQTLCVANDDLKLLDPSSLRPDFWSYGLAPPHFRSSD